MNRSNAISVCFGDHLWFGKGDGQLKTPESLKRRVEAWRDKLNASIIFWREKRSRFRGHFYAAKGHKHPFRHAKVNWDDFAIAPQICHENGLRIYLYVTIFDEGWPLLKKKEREVSYHNSMHWQHVSTFSRFCKEYPEFTIHDRTGEIKQWGVLSLSYPEVRRYFINKYLGLLNGYDFDGLFICLRSQSKPSDFADQYGFNEPIRKEYIVRCGKDICKEDFDLEKWRDLQGEYLTIFLGELRERTKSRGFKIGIGAPRGDIIGPPLGNWRLHWRKWVTEDLIDELIINQSSLQCPSLWHQLWPMHRGYGYIQNYIDDYNMLKLDKQLDEEYGPIIMKNRTNLFVARQWQQRNEEREQELIQHPAVNGLVFSSFRFDNPDIIKLKEWN